MSTPKNDLEKLLSRTIIEYLNSLEKELEKYARKMR
jgi:hypothetical protein